MAFIKTRDGTDLYVKDWGAGRPVVLIHGWPLSADSWDPQALALAEAGFRVISYDRRGFSRSDQPWTGYDYDTFADDLADVLHEAGATQDVTLVGFSMGGGEVARYMSRQGGRGVNSAALISSVVPYALQTEDNEDGVPEKQFQTMIDAIRDDRAKFFGSFFKQFFGAGIISSPVSQETLDWAWATAMMAGIKPTIDCIKAFGHTDFRQELSAFNVPTLVLHGTSDAIVPAAIGKNAARGIAQSQYVEYDGEPHGLFATAGERLTRDLLTFLGGSQVSPDLAERPIA